VHSDNDPDEDDDVVVLISHGLPERDSTVLAAKILRHVNHTMSIFIVETLDVDKFCVIVCHMLLIMQ
jgi:hypothetical protein